MRCPGLPVTPSLPKWFSLLPCLTSYLTWEHVQCIVLTHGFVYLPIFPAPDGFKKNNRQNRSTSITSLAVKLEINTYACDRLPQYVRVWHGSRTATRLSVSGFDLPSDNSLQRVAYVFVAAVVHKEINGFNHTGFIVWITGRSSTHCLDSPQCCDNALHAFFFNLKDTDKNNSMISYWSVHICYTHLIWSIIYLPSFSSATFKRVKSSDLRLSTWVMSLKVPSVPAQARPDRLSSEFRSVCFIIFLV